MFDDPCLPLHPQINYFPAVVGQSAPMPPLDTTPSFTFCKLIGAGASHRVPVQLIVSFPCLFPLISTEHASLICFYP